MTTRKLLKDEAASVAIDPLISFQEHAIVGVPSSITATVYPPGKASVVRSAAVDSVSTTVTTAAAEGADTLELAASQSFYKGRPYLVEIQSDPDEYIVVYPSQTQTSDSLVCAEPLSRAVADNSPLVGTAIVVSLLAADTANLGEGHIEIECTVQGELLRWREAFWVTEHLPRYALNATELTETYPQIQSYITSNNRSPDELIHAVWKHRMLPKLEARGIREERINTPDKLIAWHALECVFHVVRQDEAASQEYVERWKQDVETAWQEALEAKRFWYSETDESPSGSPAATGTESLRSRFTRLEFTR